VNSRPIEEGYDLAVESFVLPISLEKAKYGLYSNNSLFNYDKCMIDRGDIIHGIGKWGEVTHPELAKYVSDQTMIRERLIDTGMRLPANPFIAETKAHMNFFEAEDTENRYTMHLVVTGYDNMFADDFLMVEHWELATTDPRSNQMAFRMTYQFVWLDEPWLIGDLMKKFAIVKEKEAKNYYKDWL